MLCCRHFGYKQLIGGPKDGRFVRGVRVTGSAIDCAPVYPPCTSLGRIRCVWRFSRFVESITYAGSMSFLVRSPPPLPKPNKNGPFTVPNQQFEAESAIGGPSFASYLPGARPSFPRRRAGIVGLHARTQVTRRNRDKCRAWPKPTSR